VNTEETNPHLTAKIVVSYVRHQQVGPDQLSDLITSVHRAIGLLRQPDQPEEVLTPAIVVELRTAGSQTLPYGFSDGRY
jgi:predicted transcriptional regulator